MSSRRRSWWAISGGIGAILVMAGDRHRLAQGAVGAPLCQASQLQLTADGDNGNFARMSQHVSYLVLKNVSSTACAFSPLPELTFFDAKHSSLPIHRAVPGTEHMHPGPVVLPIRLEPGSTVRSTLYWVSGPVRDTKDRGVCLETASIGIHEGPSTLNTKLEATICGPQPGQVKIDMTRFVRPAKQD